MIQLDENILDYDDKKLREFINLSFDETILIKNLPDDKPALGNFINRIGKHGNRADLFWSDPEEITITRVTNKRVDGKKIGLFADLDLCWHCHGHTRNVDHENTLMLYCSDPGDNNYGGYLLKPEDPEYPIMTGKITKGYESTYSEVWKNLVYRHPVDGKYSLHFAPSFIVDWTYEGNSEEMWDYLYDHVFSDKYCYYHKWNSGDMIVSDQRSQLHNRSEVKGSRLLYRFCVDNSNMKVPYVENAS